MPRTARIVIPGIPHHVTHRGNLGAAVFLDETDRIAYLQHLRESARKYGTEVWCYCLMVNHVHLVLMPSNRDSLARTIRATHRYHAARLHLKTGLRGHLWSERYYSTPLDERHLWVAVRYVELNPVRAELVLIQA
jgi:putative transposase